METKQVIEILKKYQVYEAEMPIESERVNEISLIADEIQLLSESTQKEQPQEYDCDTCRHFNCAKDGSKIKIHHCGDYDRRKKLKDK